VDEANYFLKCGPPNSYMIRLSHSQSGKIVIDYIRNRSDDIIHIHVGTCNLAWNVSDEQQCFLVEDPINIGRQLKFSSIKEILEQLLLPLGIQYEFSSSLAEEW